MKKVQPNINIPNDAPLSRRGILGLLAGLALPGLLPRGAAAQAYPTDDVRLMDEVPLPAFFFAQMVYGSDQSWNPYPSAARAMMEVLIDRTSIPAGTDRVDLKIADPRLFRYPFLYWTGSRNFEPLSDKDIDRLRVWLDFGGFLLVDDAASAPGIGFDQAFQREFARLFPGEALTRLPREHTVFQSYYIIDTVAGRTQDRPYLSGVTRGDRTALIYSGNDLSGAWARDRSGNFMNPVQPGGARQRELAFRLGVNIIMYALCIDYKKDLIHVPFIEERRKGKRP